MIKSGEDAGWRSADRHCGLNLFSFLICFPGTRNIHAKDYKGEQATPRYFSSLFFFRMFYVFKIDQSLVEMPKMSAMAEDVDRPFLWMVLVAGNSDN